MDRFCYHLQCGTSTGTWLKTRAGVCLTMSACMIMWSSLLIIKYVTNIKCYLKFTKPCESNQTNLFRLSLHHASYNFIKLTHFFINNSHLFMTSITINFAMRIKVVFCTLIFFGRSNSLINQKTLKESKCMSYSWLLLWSNTLQQEKFQMSLC